MVVIKDLSFNYYFDITETIEAGFTAKDITVKIGTQQHANDEGVATISEPIQHKGNIYYVKISFGDGRVVMPTGQSEHRAEIQFRVGLPDGTKEEKISRLKASADRTVEIINLYGDKRYKKQLLVNHRVIADDFEKFKLGLATSGKYLIIDESFWETCKQIASGKAFADKSIKSTDLWQYGFSRCKNPDVVAHFLVTLLTTKGGLFNKGVAWELQHDILNTGDELMRSVKDTILEAERRGDVETLNRFGSRDANGNWYFNKSSYIDSFTDDISVQNQLTATDEKYDRYGNREIVNEKKAGEKAFDFLKKAITGTSKGAAGTFMDAFKCTVDEKREKKHWLTTSFGVGNAESAVIFNG